MTTKIADISAFESLQNQANQSMGFGSPMSVFNSKEDVVKIYKTADGFKKIMQKLPPVAEECLLAWRDYIKAVRDRGTRKAKQSSDAEVAKKNGDPKLMEIYLREDNAIRDTRSMVLAEWNKVKDSLKKLEQINAF
jgi:hypothetical protein